jgi:hypothetical protein
MRLGGYGEQELILVFGGFYVRFMGCGYVLAYMIRTQGLWVILMVSVAG